MHDLDNLLGRIDADLDQPALPPLEPWPATDDAEHIGTTELGLYSLDEANARLGIQPGSPWYRRWFRRG